MKMCLTKPGAAQDAWLIAGRWAAGAVLLAVTVAACTGGSSSSVPPVFTPSVSGQSSPATHPATRTPSPGGGSTSTRTGGAGTPSTAHASASDASHTPAPASTTRPATTSPTSAPSAAASSAPVTHSSTPTFPTAAPETGGGGTAGLQDGLVFGIGGAAVLFGIGSLAYRRRLARKFGTKRTTSGDPVDREPVDR
jgi:hypothetical protein